VAFTTKLHGQWDIAENSGISLNRKFPYMHGIPSALKEVKKIPDQHPDPGRKSTFKK